MSGPRARSTLWRVFALVVVIALVVVAWESGFFSLHDMARVRAAIDSVRAIPALPVVFVLAYIVLSAVGVPASSLTLAGGALFGTTRGIALNWLGACGGAMFAFTLARALSLGAMTTALRGDRTVAKLLGPGAPMLLFRLRLVPVVPFALLNVGSAMSSMSWGEYAVATGLGIIPITVIYTTFSASLIAGVEGSGVKAMVIALISAGAIIGITLLRRQRSPR